MRAKLAVRGTSSHPLIGLFRAHSHEVVPIPHCYVHHPLINEAVALIRDVMISLSIEPYCEETKSGALRYLQLVVGGDQIQLTLVVQKEIEGLVEALVNKKPPLWHSIWINYNHEAVNRILGDQWKLVYGKEILEEGLLSFSPKSFGQANPHLFSKIVEEIASRIQKTERVIEFYAGVGTIGRNLNVQELVAIERSHEAREMFVRGAPAHMSYLVGSSGEYAHKVHEFATIIADPPRKGLDPELLEELKKCKGSRFFYVSCHFDSLQRDCEALLESGWVVEDVRAYLLFPGSDHIEILCIFQHSL